MTEQRRTTATEPRPGICVEHHSVAEFYEDGSGQCLYCCTVETSCACTEAQVRPEQDEAVRQPNPEAVRRIVAHLWGEDFINLRAAVESFGNDWTVVPKAAARRAEALEGALVAAEYGLDLAIEQRSDWQDEAQEALNTARMALATADGREVSEQRTEAGRRPRQTPKPRSLKADCAGVHHPDTSHVDNPGCWCRPYRDWCDPAYPYTEVWVHRYADD